ncbi:hypothetical protein GGF42_002233 [Coemansia sp. RSA 2424]|nr:hypothetical protein GGF42_002233 [Coemansia sp. RSA 2424]
MVLEHVDAFFLCWELLDEVAVVAAGDARVAAAVQTQLSSGFLRTHIAPALLATMQSRSQAITTVSYLTDLITVTHSTRVLDALFVVLLGADTAPEQRPMKALPPLAAASAASAAKKSTIPCFAALSSEDQALLESIEDDALRAEAALLLLPPGTDLTGGIPPGLAATNGGQQQPMTTTAAESSVSAADPCPLRTLLIGWMTINDDDRSHLALNTLRLFDTILSTLNQFAFTSLVLRNFTEDNKSTHGGPPAALGLGVSVAADQELVRAVIERFLDAAPSNIANAMPEVVVSTAMHIDKDPLISGDNDW